MAPEIEVCCNRGTNGIEGSLSTAIGYAALSDQLNFIIIGDLSFFYDQNALWNSHIRPNVRILLINNEGGELLHNLPGMEKDEQSRAIVSGAHHTSAKAWAETRGFVYYEVKDEEQWKAVLPTITSPEPAEKPILVEAWTNKASDTALLREFYHQIKDLQ
jgi:2-succinyl-5-enolpyruvyl-6-hydroxy-3-cyclohexene-1-carboxylate synthase